MMNELNQNIISNIERHHQISIPGYRPFVDRNTFFVLRIVDYLRKLKSTIFGYFWLPCTLCGEFYSGASVGQYTGRITLKDGTKKSVCTKCTFVAGQIEALNNNIDILPEKALLFLHDNIEK